MSTFSSTAPGRVVATFDVPVPDGFVHLSMLERIYLRFALKARWPEPRNLRVTSLLEKLQPTAVMLAANRDLARLELEKLAAKKGGTP